MFYLLAALTITAMLFVFLTLVIASRIVYGKNMPPNFALNLFLNSGSIYTTEEKSYFIFNTPSTVCKTYNYPKRKYMIFLGWHDNRLYFLKKAQIVSSFKNSQKEFQLETEGKPCRFSKDLAFLKLKYGSSISSEYNDNEIIKAY